LVCSAEAGHLGCCRRVAGIHNAQGAIASLRRSLK
jgi:hypothetical protein